jgi:hypothetical protein
MIAATTDDPTGPTTLADIASALDEHRQAIAEIRDELADYTARAEVDIARHQDSARELIAQQQAIMQSTFGELMAPATPAAKGLRARRAASSGSAPKADYSARIAKRERTLALKKFSIERGYELPGKGEDFSPEVQREFDQAGGYQG